MSKKQKWKLCEAKGTGRDPRCPGAKACQRSGSLEGSRFMFSISCICVKEIMKALEISLEEEKSGEMP